MSAIARKALARAARTLDSVLPRLRERCTESDVKAATLLRARIGRSAADTLLAQRIEALAKLLARVAAPDNVTRDELAGVLRRLADACQGLKP